MKSATKLMVLSIILVTFSFTSFSQTWEHYNLSNSGICSNNIISIACDTFDNVWCGSATNGVSMFDGSNWTTYNSSNSNLSDNYVKALYVDNQNRTWAGTSDGLCMFNGTNWTVYNTSNSDIPHDNIKAINGDINDWIVVGSNGGLSIFDGVNWTNIDSLYDCNGTLISINQVQALDFTVINPNLQSNYGEIYITIDNDVELEYGIAIYNPSNPPDYSGNAFTGVTENVLNCISVTKDADNRKLVGTNSGLFVKNSTGSNCDMFYRYGTTNSDMCDSYIVDILQDEYDNKYLWIAHNNYISGIGGVSLVYLGTGSVGDTLFSQPSTIYNQSNGLAENDVRCIATDGCNVYFGLGGYLGSGGISVFRRCDNSIDRLSPDNSLKIYPNPANEVITVKGSGNLKILNGLGQVVIDTSINKKKSIQISHLPTGIYNIVVEEDNIIYNTKLIIK